MANPVYSKGLSPIKNLQALMRALSVPSIAATLESAIVQVLFYFYNTALVLSGTLRVAGASTLTGAVTLGNILVGSVQALSGAGVDARRRCRGADQDHRARGGRWKRRADPDHENRLHDDHVHQRGRFLHAAILRHAGLDGRFS